jgi:hypothetical protein
MNTTAQHVLTTPTRRHHERHGLSRAWLITLIALAALTATVAAWQLGAFTGATSAARVGTVADSSAANLPGGSIYEQQVPKAASDPLVANLPGGSVYEQQVPKAAGTDDR